ncbi:MAG: GNAT family N-acetyltransferase [Dongiaceae bacterium]
MVVRERAASDDRWIRGLLYARWGGTTMVAHGEAIKVMTLPALVAGDGGGLATYRRAADEAELVSLDAADPGHGIGTLLLDALVERLGGHGIARLWVTATNDNLSALAFYQRRGFTLRRLRPGAIGDARLLKPAIPPVASNGVPIRDEIDLCRELE